MTKYKLEYIWLDGYTPVPNLRGKTQIKEFEVYPSLEQLPLWGFDGSSTNQAEGRSSDCVLKPVAMFHDATRKNGILVMCEVMMPDGSIVRSPDYHRAFANFVGAIDGIDVVSLPTGIKDVVTFRGSLNAGDIFNPPGNPAIADLAAAMLATDWSRSSGVPADLVRSAYALSGVEENAAEMRREGADRAHVMVTISQQRVPALKSGPRRGESKAMVEAGRALSKLLRSGARGLGIPGESLWRYGERFIKLIIQFHL